MEKRRAKTLQERFGFLDAELTTPEHDEIMLWLDGCVGELIEQQSPREWTTIEIDIVKEERAQNLRFATDDLRKPYVGAEDRERLQSQIRKLSGELGVVPSRPADRSTQKIWEKPILDRSFTVGFIDLHVGTMVPALGHKADSEGVSRWHVDWRRERGSSRSPIIEFPVLFEVKSRIASVGEVIRQIRLYQTYQPGRYFIVSPDARFSSVFEQQGIGFIRYPADAL